MKKKYWRDGAFFILGTFLGSYVLGFIAGALGAGRKAG